MAVVSCDVRQEVEKLSGQVLEHQALPGRSGRVPGDAPPAPAGSYTTAQLNASLLRFLADQTAHPVVSQNRTLIVLLAASNASTSERNRALSSPRSHADIERGWAEQQQRFDERIAARPIESHEIPGAIISPPFPGFDMKVAEGARVGEAEGTTAAAPVQAR